MLKVCLVVDVEGFISLNQKNPEWTCLQNLKKKIVYILRYSLYDKRGYGKIYDLVIKEHFPVSFMLVGSIFKPRKEYEFIDYGYHTLSHKPLTYLSDERVKEEIKNIYRAMSFSAPMNLIDDPLKPKRILRLLRKEGYKIIIWGGPTIRDSHGDIVVVPPRKKIAKPVTVEGVKCVYISNFFNGKSSRGHINKILSEIKENAKKDAVYCITTHDFSDKTLKNFSCLIKELLEMNNKKIIKLANLKQIAK